MGAEKPMIYQIKVQGHLGETWVDWFEGLEMALDPDGHTRLTVSVADQAALHGLLRRVRDLGVILVSVIRIDSDPAEGDDENTA